MNCDSSIPIMLILPAGMMGSGSLTDPIAALASPFTLVGGDSFGLLGLLEQLATKTATITRVFAVMKCCMRTVYRPNGAPQPPRATGIRYETRSSSRGWLQVLCWTSLRSFPRLYDNRVLFV